MDKLKMHSPDMSQDNIAKIRELFPGCVTEARDEATGKLRLAVDFDQLRQELSDSIVEGPQERYRLDWPGKQESLVVANAPIAKSLRPAREESGDFDTTRNLFIEGDNLEALKLLQETYLGRVKMIYIDPPYNTGNDFVYDDDFSESAESFLLNSNQKDNQGNRLIANTQANGRLHSDWLSMMRARLGLAKKLLRQDGIILISIDDNEVHNLRKVCDEVFGAQNFIDNIIWKKRYGGGAKEKHLVSIHEHILMYSRNFESILDLYVPLTNAQVERYYTKTDEHFNEKGPFRIHPLEAMKSFEDRPNLRFPVPAPDGTQIWPKRQWRWSKERMDQALASGEVHFQSLKDGTWSISSKQYLKGADGETRASKFFSIVDGVYGQHGTNEIVSLLGNSQVFPFAKPSELIRKLVELVTFDDRDAICLDFFAGSGSTAHAVLQQNAVDGGSRSFILVQIPEALDDQALSSKVAAKFCRDLELPCAVSEISKERIRRAGQKILEDNCHPDWNRDVGFRVLKVDTSNMKDIYYRPDELSQGDLLEAVNNVKPDRTSEDLLFQVLVDWGVDLTLPIRRETLQDKTVFFVDDNALVACFDSGVTEDLVKELAKHEPLRVVFRDNGFVSDAVKINVEQIFRQLSPSTEVRSL
ncbi:MAG: site-specific DNA-methyltransferase [Alteromonadaceae bacterium]|nr:site-specific DNA-methyltransferase [Alteromonadaceae bacterium]|tara:strand:- start:11521 stop:13446 length:1926 start_codon:yes stop_codon:yes gene_type:complete